MAEDLSLSVNLIRRWGEELQRIESEIDRLSKEREGYLAKLQAAQLLFGSIPALKESGLPENEGPTFVGFVQDFLESSDRGLAVPEITKAIAASPLAPRLVSNPNAVYTAIGRLIKRNLAERRGRLVYAKETLKTLEESGVVISEEDDSSSVPDMVRQVLKSAGKALKAGEIMDELKKNDELALKMRANPQYGYSVLSRMVRKEQLKKSNRHYSLPEFKSPYSANELFSDQSSEP